MLQKADTGTRAVIDLWVADSATPESRAKPDNARELQIWMQTGGTAPATTAAMALQGTATSMPHSIAFDLADIGKAVWFAFRWMGKNNHPGPWSDFYSEIIPG